MVSRLTLTNALTLTTEQELALIALSRSQRRDEADRARAILMTAQGKSSAEIAPLLGVRPEQIRRWRSRFRAGDTDGLRTRKHTGRPPSKAQAALAVVEAVLAEAPLDASWTCPRLAQEVERRTGLTITANHLSVVLRQKGAIEGGDRGTRSATGKTKKPSNAVACG